MNGRADQGMANTLSSTELLGARLLREIGSEEGSLEEVRCPSSALSITGTLFKN